jgi:hypothetical protein
MDLKNILEMNKIKELENYKKIGAESESESETIINNAGDLLPDILKVIKVYLKLVASPDFLRTTNQKDSAQILTTTLDLLKFILTQNSGKSSGEVEKSLEDFRKILGGKE